MTQSNDPNTPSLSEELAAARYESTAEVAGLGDGVYDGAGLRRAWLAGRASLEAENEKLRNLLHGAIVTVGDYMPKNLLKQIKQALAKESDDDET